VKRRRIVWLLSIEVMLAGSQAAHFLTYRVVYPEGRQREVVLAESGHGYLALLPQAGGIALALLLAVLALHVSDVRRRNGLAARRIPILPFAAMPVVAFTAQEHLERLAHGGGLPLDAGLERTFFVGLLLQLPFALLAYVLARLLLEAAERVGHALRWATQRSRRLVRTASHPVRIDLAPSRCVLAGGHSGRGPPVVLHT
jgi:hypothetical protein